ncbi:MlaD family protein [Flavobacterium geliluteum]|uniref:MCE family protein n=1 Tax=Flavobacterium geliluteum TaxID=2816120 RepID=A0A940XA67_9FLAO|nr:MlaD family protein [Flavobacterium geliluteum]MBP4138667.1 MCE family protein [Flavobacterium geliluteum]
MDKQSGYTWKLGMFVTIGLLLFITAIYFIGKQRNLFGSTFRITSNFKTVSGLEIGNNVRFSGINVGTIEEITLINDSSVVVGMVLKDEVRKFIKTDARATIGSDGLMGDKVLTIIPGVKSKVMIKNNEKIASIDGIEMNDIMKSVKKSVDNAGIITEELAIFSHSMNNGNGALARLVRDEGMANSVSKTLNNLESGTKGFSENMEAAKSNFLLKGYYKKKQKKAEEKKEAVKDKKEEQEEAAKEKAEKEKEEAAKKAEADKNKK